MTDIYPGLSQRPTFKCKEMNSYRLDLVILRARLIGNIWLLWIRVRAFDWLDPDPDPLDRDLVNPATVQYNRISRSTREAHGISWNRGRSIENQLFELLGLLNPDPEQASSTNRMHP